MLRGKALRIFVGIVISGFVLAITVGVVYRPAYFLMSPGGALDLTDDVTIEGVPVDKPAARYLLVSVNLVQPTLLRALLSRFNPEVALLPRDRVIPPGLSDAEYLVHQRALFRDSRVAAAAAAARATGREVAVDGAGARIVAIEPGSPAARKLRVGDVITQVDGAAIKLMSDMAPLTTARPPGTPFQVSVKRGGRTVVSEIRSARLEGFNASSTGIGVLTTTDRLEADLPFEIRFRRRSLAGPSAGLVYALTIADMLDGSDAGRNRTVAATGAIFSDGRVGAVGGIEPKGTAARRAGAQLFLVPQREAPAHGGRSIVRGVGSLDEALAFVRAA